MAQVKRFVRPDFAQFFVLSQEQIARISECEITKRLSGSDLKNTVNDPRLGSIHFEEKCPTCKLDCMKCQGHFGHIPLNYPIVNPLYITTVLKIMNCVCHHCGRLRLGKNFLFTNHPELVRLHGEKRLAMIAEITSKDSNCVCFSCQHVSHIVVYEKSSNTFKFKNDNQQISNHQILDIMRLVDSTRTYPEVSKNPDDNVMRSLGFNARTDWNKIYYNKDVIDNNGNPEHTHSLKASSMVFTNFPVMPTCNRPRIERDGDIKEDEITTIYNSIVGINEQLGSLSLGDSTRKKNRETLQNELNALIRKLFLGAKDTNERTFSGLSVRISDFIDTSVVGKRCNGTARSVITSGYDLDVEELGVPQYIASILTRKEIVCALNHEKFVKMLNNKQIRYISRGDTLYDTSKLNNFRLSYGDIVHRPLKNGDMVIFNRQPTLLPGSMQSFKVKIIPGLVFRLPLERCTPFNADFDGDEMNLSVVHNLSANAEMEIMDLSNHLVTNENGTPCMGNTLDNVACMYMMTSNIKIYEKTSYDLFINCMMYANIGIDRFEDFWLRAKKYYPEIERNYPIPSRVALSIIMPRNFCYNRNGVNIKDGIIQKDSQVITSKTSGKAKYSIIHLLWKDSPKIAIQWLNDCKRFTSYWVTAMPYTVTLKDVMTDEKTQSLIDKELDEAEREYDEVVERSYNPEKDQSNILISLGNSISKIIEENTEFPDKNGKILDHNNIKLMVESGAKGKKINPQQIRGCVGQQIIDGERMPIVINGDRTLTFFPMGDNSPLARGFVYGNFTKGLSCVSYFFHQAAGIRGLAETANTTADAGYMSKKFNQTIGGKTVNALRAVVAENDMIILPLYGGDGISSQHSLEFGKWCDLEHMIKCLNSLFELENPKKKKQLYFFNEKEAEMILSAIEKEVKIFSDVVKVGWNAVRKNLLKDITKYGIYPEVAQQLGEKLLMSLLRALVPSGTMAGALASSAISEPVTQLALSSFHTTGDAKSTFTSGIKGMSELANARKEPSQPMMILQVNDPDIKELKEVYLSTKDETKKSNLKLSMYKKCAEYTKDLVEKSVKDFAKNITLVYKKGAKRSPVDYGYYEPISKEWDMAKFPKEYDGEWGVLIQCDLEKLQETQTYLVEIENAINDNEAFFSISSALCKGEILVMPNYSALQKQVYSKLEIPETTREALRNEENINFFTCRDVAVDFISSIVVSGIKGIHNMNIYHEEKDKSIEFFIQTDGINLYEVQFLDFVNKKTIKCNSIWEISRVYGIEGTRNYIHKEFDRILSEAKPVSAVHISILSATMTSNGIPTAAHREGIPRSVGPFAKTFFEQTMKNATTSALGGERDLFKSLISTTIAGIGVPGGTENVKLKKAN